MQQVKNRENKGKNYIYKRKFRKGNVQNIFVKKENIISYHFNNDNILKHNIIQWE